ncbi:MAG TPA: N-acetylglucosamine-6-phosphate deacetylase [Ktedonobacterales bacterium]|nr:N-acetylglucosamine-6-phosphate deacetylase [Ktedonobacterales bacterium]
MRFMLRGARLVDASTDRASGAVIIADGKLEALTEDKHDADSDMPTFDVDGMILTPGFMDIHTHGGGGFNLHTSDPAEIDAFAHWAPSTGLTSFLVAVVGVPDALPIPQLEAAVVACERDNTGAEPVGIYLEGPYINLARRGAHLASWLRLPDLNETNALLELSSGHLRLITLAPELPGAAPVIRRLVEGGVTVSIGHTDATFEQTLEAIERGITHITHCCNAMRPLLHREPGPLGAVALSPQVTGELIVDGVHVHPAMVTVINKTLGADRTIVITDAQAGAGKEGATFEFAGQPAHVERGAARLADGTITGSVLTMDQALRNTLRMMPVSLSEAVSMLTLNPARSIHVDVHKGRLHPSYDADLLLFSPDLTLQATFCRGKLAYATDAWRARLAGL